MDELSILFKGIEDSFQMDASSEENQLRRRIACANIELFLRVGEVGDMRGSRSELWNSDYQERKGE